MYNTYFISRVRDFEDGSTEAVDHLDFADGDYYTVYGRTEEGFAHALEDHTSLEDATAAMLRIGVENEKGGTL